MIKEFILQRKKFIAGSLAFYFIFFGGLMLYTSKMTTTDTSLETIIHTTDKIVSRL